MGFWSGFEGLTGHRPGAFKGFSLKDILDKDMWERRERLNQGRRFEETGVPETTNWYRGRGRPEMMGPRVGAAEAGVKENRLMDERPDMFAGVNQRAFDAATLANQQRRNALWGSGPATVRAARPWANLQPDNLLTPSWAGASLTEDRDVGMGAGRFLQLGDPRNIRSGPDLPPASRSRPLPGVGRDRPFPLANKKTVKKIFADPSISNEITETIEEKIPSGSAQWGNSRHPPNWLQRMDEGYFGRPTTFSSPMQPEGAFTAQPTSIMNMNQPGFLEKLGSGIGEQWGNLWDASVLRKGPGAWDAIKAQLDEARRKRYEEAMRARRGY